MRTGSAAVIGLLGLGLAALVAAGDAASGRSTAGAGAHAREAPVVPVGTSGDASGERAAPRDAEPARAEELMSALGCGACHTGVPEPAEARRVAPRFGPEGRARPADSLLAVLLSSSPRRTTASPARMPDFHLSPPEALALTLYLESTLPEAEESGRERVADLRGEHPAVDADLGRRLFLALDCAGCHGGTDVPAWTSAPDLSAEGERARRGWLTTWLARPTAVRPAGFYPGTGTRMPDFGLSGSELRTLVDHLAPPGEGPSDAAPAGTAAGEAGAAAAAAETPAGRTPEPSALAPPDADPLSAFDEARAERLLAERSACLGCHALAGEGGRIAPDLAGARLRRPDAYVWSMIRDPGGTRPRTVMPRSPEAPARDTLFYRLLTTGELSGGEAAREDARAPSPEASGDPTASGASPTPEHAGYVDLVSHPVRAPDSWMLEERAAPTTAAERYRHRCASCHGVDGGGDGFNARYLRVPPARHADSAAMAVRTDARLYNGIHGGGRVLGRSSRMPAFGRSLDREAMWGLVGHIRELCDCRGPAWHRDNDESGVPDGAGGGGP